MTKWVLLNWRFAYGVLNWKRVLKILWNGATNSLAKIQLLSKNPKLFKHLCKHPFQINSTPNFQETADIILSGARELLIVPRPKGHKNPNRKIYMKNMKQQEAFEAYQKMLEDKEASKKSEAKLKPKKEAGPKLTRAEL